MLQANLSLQAAGAVATAESGDVNVEQGGQLTAGLDGIDASSEAIAKADLEQEAEQKNEDSKDITRDDGGDSENPATGDQPATIAIQDQEILQANVNLQLGFAVADAQSGDVDVKSLDELEAGEDGIVAKSKAVAIADLDQKAEQENESEVSATAPLVIQDQDVLQFNLNVQAAAAVASADSGDVTVWQSGGLHAGTGGVTGDGITAESKAVAVATLEQKAEQDNENSAEANLVAPSIPLLIGSEDTLSLHAVGLQEQLVGQFNLNAQLGFALADADAGDVEVRSSQDPSFGNGITAEFEAFAKAEIDQDIDQDNENEASITVPTFTTTAEDGGLAIAAQLEGVLQANLSLQAAAAFATADAGEVNVTKEGELDAGETGIEASSSAAAVADLEQQAEQENEDTKEITVADDAEPSDETIAAQLAFVGQGNFNLQAGIASADATSDEVKVQSLDSITAGGDGINASSEASAKADLEQEAEQTNDSELAAVGDDTFQLQFFGQFNENEQIGFANAEATSDYVEVGQSGPLSAGGSGIIASSEAVAIADLDQKVEQENENEVSGTDDFSVQRAEQTNVSSQIGFANAEAYSGEVKVRNLEDPSEEDGINAKSKAVAVAKLEQNVDQDNENSGGALSQSVNQANQSEQIVAPERTVSAPTVTQGTAPVEQTTAPDQSSAPIEPVVKGEPPVAQGPTRLSPVIRRLGKIRRLTRQPSQLRWWKAQQLRLSRRRRLSSVSPRLSSPRRNKRRRKPTCRLSRRVLRSNSPRRSKGRWGSLKDRLALAAPLPTPLQTTCWSRRTASCRLPVMASTPNPRQLPLPRSSKRPSRRTKTAKMPRSTRQTTTSNIAWTVRSSRRHRNQQTSFRAA